MAEQRLRCCFIASAAAAAAFAYDIAPITDQMRQDAAALIKFGAGNPIIYDRLATMIDTYGPRMSGSQGLEQSLTYIVNTARSEGMTVIEEPVLVTNWVRGTEWASMVSPRNKSLHFLGLGMSNSTNGVVTAPVMVVHNRSEFLARTAEVPGKIVLFNVEYTGYDTTYRSNAAVWVAQYGGVGALIRAVGPWGIQTPHTGGSTTAAIASGAVSLEDATQMQRMVDRGQSVVVSMYMEAKQLPDAPSRNVIIEIPGTTKPGEYVVVGGHMDSWDVAEGAMDDGGGAFASWHALRAISMLGLKSARTLRAVMFVNEENGNKGGIAYSKDYAATLPLTSIAIESDEGSFSPRGLGFSGHPTAQLQVDVLSPLLAPLNASYVTSGGGGTDISPSCNTGVPCAGLRVLDPRLSNFPNNPCAGLLSSIPDPGALDSVMHDGYFLFHHTGGDTIDRLAPQQLQDVSTALAIWVLSIGNLPDLLPRTGPSPTWSASPSPGSGGGGNGPSEAGSIAGSVIGGLCAVGLAAGGFVYLRRRRESGAYASMPMGGATSGSSMY